MNRNKALIVLLFFISLGWSACSRTFDSTRHDTVTARNALKTYLMNDDKAFHWKFTGSHLDSGVMVSELLLTSQEWKGIPWQHQLTVLIPENTEFNDALLVITGGSLKNKKPETAGSDDELMAALLGVCRRNRAVVSILRQVPNQPLFDDLYEDALISYTFHKFQETDDFSWPLLFPMTKSACKAMDAVQEFCLMEKKQRISGFLVSGASKRGWTSWLTGVSDSRVKAICPMVFDVLNMPVQMDYQVTSWGSYSEEIQDYIKLGITENVGTPEGRELVEMIDPYSYREDLTLPKLIVLGTNDPYWPVDAVRHYLEELPGKNYLHYVPNAGHDLNGGEEALGSLSAFFTRTLRGMTYPDCTWSVSRNVNKIEITAKTKGDESPAFARLWTAASADRDFRDETWISTELACRDVPKIQAAISLPLQGFRAFYLDLLYFGPDGNSFSSCSRVFVMDSSQVF